MWAAIRWETIARRSRVASLGPEPWNVSEWWNEQPPALTTTGTSSGSTPSGAAAAHRREPVLGRVEAAAVRRHLRPAVRAARVLDRAALGARVVERHPAGDHLRRHQVVGERAVLVHAQRARAGRLPEAVVLQHARAAVAHQLGGDAADPLAQSPAPRSRRRRASRCRSGGCGPRGRARASSSPRRAGCRWRTRPRTARSKRSRSNSTARSEMKPSSTITKPSRWKRSTWSSVSSSGAVASTFKFYHRPHARTCGPAAGQAAGIRGRH